MLIKAHLVGIPRSNDNLYRKMVSLVDELGQNITNVEDYRKLTDYLDYCRNSSDEYYFQSDLVEPDLSGAPERIKAFLKFKGIQNHYTFKDYWQITVKLEGFVKPEYFLIFPLYIRMKDTKVFEQMKILEYNQDSGEIIAKEVDPEWFIVEKTPIPKKKRKRSLQDEFESVNYIR